MKKLFLATMICAGLLLPAISNTSSAANKLTKRIITSISGWVFSATSSTEEGTIKRIEIYRIPTGEFARALDYDGTNNTEVIDLQGLPHASYSARISCTYVVATKQFKL